MEERIPSGDEQQDKQEGKGESQGGSNQSSTQTPRLGKALVRSKILPTKRMTRTYRVPEHIRKEYKD